MYTIMFSFFLNIFLFSIRTTCTFSMLKKPIIPVANPSFLMLETSYGNEYISHRGYIKFYFRYLLACHQTHIPKETTNSLAPQHWKTLGQAVQGSIVDYELIINNRTILEEYMAWLATHGPLTDRDILSGQEKRRSCYYVNAQCCCHLWGSPTLADLVR